MKRATASSFSTTTTTTTALFLFLWLLLPPPGSSSSSSRAPRFVVASPVVATATTTKTNVVGKGAPTTKAVVVDDDGSSRSQKQRRRRTATLAGRLGRLVRRPGGDDDVAAAVVRRVVDYGSLFRYAGALLLQTACWVGLWRTADRAAMGLLPDPAAVVVRSRRLFFWARFLAVYVLNAQVASWFPLPTVKERATPGDLSPDRKRPSWTPPGWVFVLMWPVLVFGARAYAVVVVADAVGGRFDNAVTRALMLHLAIAGLWSHVNRIRGELGVGMVLLYGLFLSKATTAYLAYRIDRRAGIALACTLPWLLAASALGTETWRINPDPITGRKMPLLPMKEEEEEERQPRRRRRRHGETA